MALTWTWGKTDRWHVEGLYEVGKDPIPQRDYQNLGDAIALAGAAVELSKRCGGSLVLPIRKRHAKSIASIFSEYHGIELCPTLDPWCPLRDQRDSPFRSGVNLLFQFNAGSLTPSWKDLYAEAYERVGVPYKKRWQSSPIPGARKLVAQLPAPSGQFLFVHDDHSRGYHLARHLVPTGVPVFLPEPKLNLSILSYCDVIEAAAEIHVMDSSFFHLIEHLNPRGKLFFHRYVKFFHPICNHYWTRLNWTILNDDGRRKWGFSAAETVPQV